MAEQAESPSSGAFIFLWGRPAHGEIKLVRDLDNDAILAGSTSSGWDGKEWIPFDPFPEEHRQGPWLTAEWAPWTRYAPFSIPGLHRRFARVKPNESAIRRFASRYGLLTESPYIMRPKEGGGLAPANRIESLEVWQRELVAMKRLVKIWDAIQRKDTRTLKQWVKWTTLSHPEKGWVKQRVIWDDEEWSEAGVPPMEGAGEWRELGLEDTRNKPIPTSWKSGDVIAPAYYYACWKINDRLEGHVEPKVMPFINGDIMLWPDSLLSAMYSMFALEASGRTRPALTCRGCGSLFTPMHGSQRYCEAACRKSRWWRAEKGKETSSGTREADLDKSEEGRDV